LEDQPISSPSSSTSPLKKIQRRGSERTERPYHKRGVAKSDPNMQIMPTFDVVPSRKRVKLFKLDELWVLKHFFDDKEIFKALLDYYNPEQYRFEFKFVGARNNALKILERNGFDYELVEDLTGYIVQIPKSARYAQILRNSVATKETMNERIFLMKDFAAVEEAVSLGAKLYQVEVRF
jgi:hypothetical protein